MAKDRPISIDRYSLISDLAIGIRRMLQRIRWPLATLLGLATASLFLGKNPGGIAFGLMSAGAILVISTWSQRGLGVPIMPMLAVQNLVLYGLPILVGNESMLQYPDYFVTKAGIEVLIFFGALTAGWSFGMETFRPARPFAYTFRILTLEGNRGLRRIGFGLLWFITGYQILQGLWLQDIIFSVLPNGSFSLLNAITSAAGMCGFFIISLGIGSGDIKAQERVTFWILFTINCVLAAATFLLSATAAYVVTVSIGLFWGSGRAPVRFLGSVILLLAFFNLGKFEMRERYWDIHADSAPELSLMDLPGHFVEWTVASLDALTGASSAHDGTFSKPEADTKQSLFERVNNLQNMLYVIDEVETRHTPVLFGATYTLIPPLLIPRILWPDKPRSHEGQVMLNVHFGRQDLQSTQRTYIAWGLLAEGYGNFGPIWGMLILGGVIGFALAWMENFFARKPILSMEGFIVFTIFLGMAASYEMVASVLVTSIFQSIVPIIGACMPFVHRKIMIRPEEGAA